VAKDPYPGAASEGEPDDAPVGRRRGGREPGVGGVVPVRGRGGRQPGPDGGGEGGRDELLGHGVELGEEVLQIPHLARAGVRLLGARLGVVGGGLDDGHRSREGGFWKVRERRRRRRRGGGGICRGGSGKGGRGRGLRAHD
jgi:hypothetical protein